MGEHDHELANEHPMAAVPNAGGQAALGLPVARPSIEIRVVLVTVIDHRLSLALNTDGGDCLRLLGGPALRGEPLDAGARRIVRERTGLRKHYLEQLYTVSNDQDGQWLVIAAYLGLIWFEDAPEESPSTEWLDMRVLPPLIEVEQLLVEYGLTRLRAKIGYTTVAFHLLPPAFTLPDLQGTYETILGRSLDKRNFRRRVVAAGFLEPTGDVRRDGSHRPAAMYRFQATHDQERYLTPAWENEP